MVFKKITILGVGLIGASFALAMKQNGLCGDVIGYGRTEGNLMRAKERGIIDSYKLDPGGAVADADLIVIATPVGVFSELTERVKDSIKKDAVVIDVGSVKGRLVHELDKSFGGRFVGCHPIAGGEKSGIDLSDPGLFNGALCIITKTDMTRPDAFDKVSKIWEIFGSRVETMTPEEHDRVYALVSHLPHVVAYALVNTVSDMDSAYLKYAGRGFKDMTRIASSSEELWRDICLLNGENISGFLNVFIENTKRLCGYIEKGDRAALESDFKKARRQRKAIEG